MKIKSILLLLASLLISTGCYGYGTLKGKVVDAETGEPIEGAVAMAEWTKTKGFGNTYTVSAKVVEAISDKEGNFELGGCLSPFVNEPSLTIYKKGYVAWNNKYLFPDWIKREGFQWNSGNVFRMERFKKNHSYIQHESFIYNVAISGLLEHKKKFVKSYMDSEGEEVLAERQRKDRVGE